MPWLKPEEKKSGAFIKLEDGTNRVRIVSEPVEEFEHMTKNEEGKWSVSRCIGRGCPVCQMGDKSKKRYHFAAISRNDQMKNEMKAEVKLLTVGQQVYGQLWDLMTSEDWKFETVPDYDMNIIRKGEKLNTEYSVQPLPRKELNAADAETVKSSKNVVALVNERYGSANPEREQSANIPRKTDTSDVKVEEIPF